MEIRFNNVTLKYDDKPVLDNISFTLPDKKLISFLGPSGSGKSTTLYLISGLLEATEGQIFFDDKDVSNLDSAKRNVGLVFQNYALYPHMTVLENIMFPLKIQKVEKSERKKKAMEMAELTRIQDLLDKYPGQLSGGQQQRVAISRAMVKNPDVLLMDEPLSNLDAKLRLEMREEIRRIQRETEITTIFVTHDQDEALNIADTVMLLNDGEIQQMSDPMTIYKKPENKFVASFIGSEEINFFTKENRSLNAEHPLLKQFDWETLAIRPESLFIVDNAEDYLVKAQVESIDYNFNGKDKTLYARDAYNHRVVVSGVEEELAIATGETIHLSAHESNLIFYDYDNTLIRGVVKNES